MFCLWNLRPRASNPQFQLTASRLNTGSESTSAWNFGSRKIFGGFVHVTRFYSEKTFPGPEILSRFQNCKADFTQLCAIAKLEIRASAWQRTTSAWSSSNRELIRTHSPSKFDPGNCNFLPLTLLFIEKEGEVVQQGREGCVWQSNNFVLSQTQRQKDSFCVSFAQAMFGWRHCWYRKCVAYADAIWCGCLFTRR